MSRTRRSSRLAAVGLLLALLAVRTVPAAQTFRFSGDRMETVLTKGRERTVLTGNAVVETEENVIRADVMELYGPEFRFIHCRGNVRVLNQTKGIELSGEELLYNRDEKVIRVDGNVVLLDKKNEIVVKGGFLENWEDRDETVIQIGVRILKKDLVCRSEYARYLRGEDLLELSGMPLVRWKGDEYQALKIYIDLEDDTIRMEGDIRGTVTSTEEAPAEGGGKAPAEGGGKAPAEGGGKAPAEGGGKAASEGGAAGSAPKDGQGP